MKFPKIIIACVLVVSTNFVHAQSNTPCAAGSVIAPALTVGASCTYTAGTTVGATQQTNAANAGSPSCGLMGPDVWYSFVAPASGSVVITTTAGGITDGVMSLYSGSCGSWTELACDDQSGPGSMPEISYNSLTPGNTYLVRFWDWWGGTGTFNICISQAAPPAGNTTCTVQTPICSGSPINFVANTGGTAASVVNPGNNYNCLSTSPNPSWYYLQIATPGNLVVDITAGSDVDFAIWGPFASQAAGAAACNSYAMPLDCSYSIAAVEQVNVAGVLTNQVYVLLVTNYANTVQSINVTNAGGTATTNCAIVPLPVGYTSWDAYLSADKVRLNWTTETEVNSDFYAIQRSTDGGVWETIGFVDAAGNSNSAKSYGFVDEKPRVGLNYYRLKQVDTDGSADYTSTIPVEYMIISALDVYPNPAKGLVFVKEKQFEIQTVELIDVTGRAWILPYTKANNGVSVDISQHAKGTYTVRSIDAIGNMFSTLLVIE